MNHDFSVILVEDEYNQRMIIADTLKEDGYDVKACSSVKEAREAILKSSVGCIISDFRLDDATGEDLLKWTKANDIDAPFIIITAFGDVKKAVSLLKMGARDYFTKPLDLDKILNLVHSCIHEYSLKLENSRLKNLLSSQSSEQGIVSRSPLMLDIMRKSMTAALKNVPVCINGETGTGKEMFARFIHDSSQRVNGPFIPVNCGAIPKELIESELFGYVKGAFTGASADRKGTFEAANGGTVFLDEIGELPLDVQSKFLRVLQEKKVRPVGSNEHRDIDFRVICATHRDLREMTERGSFREDLYFRLNIVSIKIPALRNRKEDIELLSRHFIEKYAIVYGSTCTDINDSALEKLKSYPWPGNVRELENVIQSAMVFSTDSKLAENDIKLELNIHEPAQYTVPSDFSDHVELPETNFNLKKNLESLEKAIIQKTLVKFENNKSRAAKYLEMDEKSIRYKIKKYSL